MHAAPFTASALGQLALPGMALSNSSKEKSRFAALKTSHSRTAVMTKNHPDRVETNARSIAKKPHAHRGHASASQLKRILTDADGVGTNVLKVVDPVAELVGVGLQREG